jgi:nitrogen fixation/metabolism regulation signal transduction histidine kinase
LSAERLEMKLTGKLPDGEQAILVKSIKTIVDQVDAMKRLVNEFRDYARLPVADLKPLDFNALVLEVLSLYGEETAAVPVNADLDKQCPRVMGDALQLRQVIHNLLQNAQDATPPERAHLGASAFDGDGPWQRISRAYFAACLRTLHHHQAAWNWLGFGGGEENCRRTRRPH